MKGYQETSSLTCEAAAWYDTYQLDNLPPSLRRNSLDYYYLSIYPSLKQMRPLPPNYRLPYPGKIHNLYIHVPFCSGVCDFCSYYLLPINPKKRAAITDYLDLAKQELLIHQDRTQLDITYLFLGGGTPSLIPPDALAAFFEFMAARGMLNPKLLGTIELHPEFFCNPAGLSTFLDISLHFRINRVSIGYQTSDQDLLHATKRRHSTAFIPEAMKLLRQRGFLINLDLIYGLPGQSLPSWEASLRDAVTLQPDSISTYFLFVDKGTATYNKLQKGQIALPGHRHIQTQHLMARLYLESQGFHELPNDFYSRPGGDPAGFHPQRLPSDAHTLPIGPGAYGYFNNLQFSNLFDLNRYRRRVASGRTPIWRGHHLTSAQSIHRDVIFALKNDPYLDCRLFKAKYNRSLAHDHDFAPQFAMLQRLGLVTLNGLDDGRVQLTGKGRLCVEEISSLFHCPDITEENTTTAERALLDKHNFAPTYPGTVGAQQSAVGG